MKLFRFISVLLLLTGLVFSVNGQKKSSRSTNKTCKTNSVAFPCLKGFQVKSSKSNNVFVAFDAKNKVGIYAFNPTADLSDQNLIDETLKTALQILYGAEYGDYEWKDSQDFNDDSKWSKNETAKFAKVGFNKNKQQTIHLQMVRLKVGQKDVLAGFVYELTNGEEAQSYFRRWGGGGNGDASDALMDLITKITGEKKTDETPGGPPRAIG